MFSMLNFNKRLVSFLSISLSQFHILFMPSKNANYCKYFLNFFFCIIKFLINLLKKIFYNLNSNTILIKIRIDLIICIKLIIAIVIN
jgi:hypothetical protein